MSVQIHYRDLTPGLVTILSRVLVRPPLPWRLGAPQLGAHHSVLVGAMVLHCMCMRGVIQTVLIALQGHHIARLAADLRDFLKGLDLQVCSALASLQS